MNYKTIKEAAHEYNLVGNLIFKKGVEYATTWNKINITDVKTFPDENEPVLVKDGDWLSVGSRHGSVFFTDGDSIEITNDLEWRLIYFK